MDNQRNLLLAVVLCGLLLFGWEAGMRYVYPQPDTPVTAAGRVDAPTQRAEGRLADGSTRVSDDLAETMVDTDLDTALASSGRIRIDAGELAGSINPVGARIDDIVLKSHRQTVEKDSGPVRMFAPQSTPVQQFAQFGWVGSGATLPDARTVWETDGDVLTPATPVTLRWDNGAGQRFQIELSVDDQYMISARQTVVNTAGGPVVVTPFALVNRTSLTASASTWNVHSGPIGMFGDAVDFGYDYDDIEEMGTVDGEGSAKWIGFTDIYWMSALIPDAGTRADGTFRSLGQDRYRADLIYAPETVQSGRQVSRTTQLFVGAKESDVLDGYEEAGVAKFDLAIDWGWFRWFEKPIFWLLTSLDELVGNFGLAIILLTVLIRAAMFPIAQKGFASMAAMRAIQPKMKAIQERHKEDKQKQQQEVMALYKKEGVNPLAGCLPMLLQIPVFFALYKVLILAIEMRHEPFILWIRDLSAPDPATILNLFGLLPFDPPSFLAIGVLAVLLGVTMWLTFRLNPTAMDPVQQQLFNIMPWVLMFVMAPFAAGLLLYWTTSNLLTLAQQSYLYSRHPQLKQQAAEDRAKKAAEAEAAKKT
ncbi:Membrane protein insertase YidC [Alteripontixanthobacter maritimus]|uniref:Membrane protein insertase YidC n=1 Tax=Alteripontixanthobacter maritimus TaxID=2161824 RepID=A0A369Q8K5_9SPHN|nr:membrane protein insertase YidC [Alteripontixanthobacter maritimus]RDC60812.1 Membrane protein insertase YidC [Alteripontixanthobacter maritimus]